MAKARLGLVLLIVLLLPAALFADVVIFSDAFNGGSGGDYLWRGFYLSSYPGTNLNEVTLGYLTFTPGVYTTSLTVRLGAFDGPIIGSTQTITTSLTDTDTFVTYVFGGAPVPLGSIVTFTQALISGPGTDVYFDTGNGGLGVPGPALINETEGTSPPLDTFRRNSVGIIVTEIVPEPSSLMLLGSGLMALAASVRRKWLG